MAQIFELSLEDISAKMTQLEQTVRQMSDDQFVANLAIGQVPDAAIGDADASINSHVRQVNVIMDQINSTVNLLDTDLTGIQNTLNNVLAAIASFTGYFQETAGVTVAGTTAVVDMSLSPASKFGIRVLAVGDTSDWTVNLEVDLVNVFTGNNTSILTHNLASVTGVTLFVVDKPARFMRARTASITRVTGSITIDIFAMP